MVYNLWVYVYWFVYKTHFRHTVALAPENVAVRGLMTVIQHWFTLIGLVSMTCFNSKATPTIDNNYSCHIKAVVGA